MENPQQSFYNNAINYWNKIPPTIDGMLGGFAHISPIDIQGSKTFLQQLFRSKNSPGRSYALDCGAGIGRISKHLLLNFFSKVDLVEQNSEFLDKSKSYISPQLLSRVGNFYAVGLQDFKPEENKYDVVWIQWVVGHLTDTHFVNFFETCKKALKPNGMIIVKENITSSGGVEVDETDSSVTRPLSHLKHLFDQAGLSCYRQMKQASFPKEIYNVYMFALRPKLNDNIQIPFEKQCDIEKRECEGSDNFGGLEENYIADKNVETFDNIASLKENCVIPEKKVEEMSDNTASLEEKCDACL